MQSVPDMKTITQHLQQALVITMACHCFGLAENFRYFVYVGLFKPRSGITTLFLTHTFKQAIEYDLQMLQQQQDLLKREQQADKNLYNYSMRCQIG